METLDSKYTEKYKEIMVLRSETHRAREDKEEADVMFKKQKIRMERDVYELDN
jgi:hypothetical protein